VTGEPEPEEAGKSKGTMVSSTRTLCLAAAFLALSCSAYDNNAPGSRLPVLGWSSWVALGPSDQHPIFDYCDEAAVKAAADAFAKVTTHETPLPSPTTAPPLPPM